jgi:glycine/D-amino acid oxidase-like deaminating enzyme
LAQSSSSQSASEIRDLRTGSPVWRVFPSRGASTQGLFAGAAADVVIVGAGITGALLAEALTTRGLSTIVLDRRQPGHGSTAASTALLQYEIDTPLTMMRERIGAERSARAWQRSYRSVADLGVLVRRLGIASDFFPRSAVYLAGDVLDPQQLATECEARRTMGLPTMFLSASELHSLANIDAEAGLFSRGAAEVNPVQLTEGLLASAVQRGCRLFAPVQIAEIEPRDDAVDLATDNGVEIHARHVVFATGYELVRGVPIEGHKRSSTWVFATKPQPDSIWSGRELIWEASDPYLYIRTTSDGRVVVGGEDEDLDDEQRRDAMIDAKVEVLQAKAKKLLPAVDMTAEFRWAGTFGESENGLPTIGAVPGMPRCYAVLGYGGNGITFAVAAAQIIAAELCGQADPDAEVFAFKGS